MGADRARRAARLVARNVVRAALSTPAGVRVLNRLHAVLPMAQKRRFCYLFIDLQTGVDGRWAVEFAGRALTWPLHRHSIVGWRVAVGFQGYDPEMHQLYEALVAGPDRPRVVFDVGANYGGHSLRFLAHGIRTVSFEPNPACHPYFLEACALNRVTPELHPVALGPGRGWAHLIFPADATHLGTIDPDVAARWRGRPDTIALDVPVLRLDDVVERHGVLPDLVKIDTEGTELGVLRGAMTTLERARPLVVFESWPGRHDRRVLHDLLDDAGYAIGEVASESGGDFLASPASNFVARPREAARWRRSAAPRVAARIWWIPAMTSLIDAGGMVPL